MKIGVIGGGVTGQATARVWLEHCDEVRVWDLVPERRTVKSMHDCCSCDLVFVCLPESQVDTFFQRGDVSPSAVNYVLRSTVPIGTTRSLAEKYGLKNLVHSPEFLTARCAMTDAQMPARNIIGCPTGKIYKMRQECWYALKQLYEKRFPGVQTITMTSDESEAVKLFTNAFFATKVSLFNEFRSLADKLEMDWELVLLGMLSDGRISHSHTQVPGPDGKRGFGGACLPKDLEQLMRCYEEARVEAQLLIAARWRNNRIDRKGEVDGI